jgi:hypothetical protein
VTKKKGLFVVVNGVKVPVPELWPIGGEPFKTVLFDVIPIEREADEEQTIVFARIVFATSELHLLKNYGSMESFIASISHELNEGVNSNCDLRLTHTQIATLGQFCPAFWLAFVMAQ